MTDESQIPHALGVAGGTGGLWAFISNQLWRRSMREQDRKIAAHAKRLDALEERHNEMTVNVAKLPTREEQNAAVASITARVDVGFSAVNATLLELSARLPRSR